MAWDAGIIPAAVVHPSRANTGSGLVRRCWRVEIEDAGSDRDDALVCARPQGGAPAAAIRLVVTDLGLGPKPFSGLGGWAACYQLGLLGLTEADVDVLSQELVTIEESPRTPPRARCCP